MSCSETDSFGMFRVSFTSSATFTFRAVLGDNDSAITWTVSQISTRIFLIQSLASNETRRKGRSRFVDNSFFFSFLIFFNVLWLVAMQFLVMLHDRSNTFGSGSWLSFKNFIDCSSLYFEFHISYVYASCFLYSYK